MQLGMQPCHNVHTHRHRATATPPASLGRHAGWSRRRPSATRYICPQPSATTPVESLDPGAWSPLQPLEQEPLLREIADALRFKRERSAFDNEYLLGLVWQQRYHVVLSTITLFVCTASNLAAPVLSGMLLEALINQRPIQEYGKTLAILSFGYVLEPLLTQVYMRNLLIGAEKVLAILRMELFRTLLMQRITFFDRHSAVELTNLISVELDTIRSFVFNNTSRDRGLRALLEMTGSVAVLFWLSWRLAPVCSIVIVATGFAATVYRRKTRDVEQRQGRALQRMTSVAMQALDSMRTVRAFAGEALERERFQAQVEQSFKAGAQFANAKAWFEATNRAAIHASLLALYAWGGWLVATGLMPVGVMISGIGFTFSLMYATQGAVSSLSDLRRASGAFSRIRELIDSSDPDPSMYGALPPGAWWEVANGRELPPLQPYADMAGDAAVEAARIGPLELREVGFTYPTRPEVPVLSGLTLTLPKGGVTAVVGRSGSGKSTVASLIARFYKAQVGGIFLAGKPALSFTRGEWSKAIAMVSQDPVLFTGTIAENIAYGKWGKATMEEIIAAATSANAHEFITELPDGYNTTVGERGLLLSGGQRQRIAIARALLKDSPIIILDEATSALDSVSEAAVQQAVQRLVRGRTVLVIAHRLSTVQSADQIVVMAGGKIIEVGTHAELSTPGTKYSELMMAQELIMSSA